MQRGASGINALIALNKPCGMTSHDVVSRVRRAVGEKRVGHAGTLDPDASGVLVVGIGQATRLMGLLTAERKSYIARVEFGSETNTDDAEGEVVKTAAIPAWAYDSEKAASVLEGLVGPHMQVPPSFSAISVNGVRSYARARAGESFELDPRPVTIFEAKLLGIEGSESEDALTWLCSFEVSKGCYIRAIARDLGRQIDSAAHLSALCRTSSGMVSLEQALSLEDLQNMSTEALMEHTLDPAVSLGLPVRRLTDAELHEVASGKALPFSEAEYLAPGSNNHSFEEPLDNSSVALVFGSKLYGVWTRKGSRLICSVNFPAGIEGVRL